MIRVLDAHALLAYLEKEPGWKQVETFLAQAAEKNTPMLMSVVNFGEVYYIILRELGREKADDFEKILETLPIEVVSVDRRHVKQAAYFKAKENISYADCFAAALAKLRNAQIVTGDREFKILENEVRIHWI